MVVLMNYYNFIPKSEKFDFYIKAKMNDGKN